MRLKSLRQALAPLTKFGQEETSFEVEVPGEGSIQVCLRPLLPKEEIECQRRAREILLEAQEREEEKEEVSRAAAIEYFDKFRIEVISYALVQVGDQSFRGEKFVDTDEVLPNGTPIRIPIHQALRELISEEWSRSMITICWSKYGELMTKIAQRAEKIAEQTISDMDAEIQRVSERLTRLKAEREERAKGDPTVTMDQIRALTNLGKALEEEVEDTIQRVQAEKELRKTLEENEDLPEEDFPEEPPPVKRREPVIPPVVPPPTSKPPYSPPRREPENPPEEFRSSFEDTEDSLAQELEFARIREAQRISRENSKGVSGAEPIGVVTSPSGKSLEAYRLPSETISSRGGEAPPREKRNPVGNHNPNFVPPKR